MNGMPASVAIKLRNIGATVRAMALGLTANGAPKRVGRVEARNGGFSERAGPRRLGNPRCVSVTVVCRCHQGRQAWLSIEVNVRWLVAIIILPSIACGRPAKTAPSAEVAPGGRGGVHAPTHTGEAPSLRAPAQPVIAMGAGGAGGAPSGAENYARLCAPCHGVDGQGYMADHAPSLVNPTFLESASDKFLKGAIAFGRPGTSMSAYGRMFGGPLEDGAIDDLVRFLRRRGADASAGRVGPVPPPPPATMPRVLPRGSAARGGEIYNRVCKTCHGDAQVRGEAVHLANGSFLRDASDAFITHGRPGPSPR